MNYLEMAKRALSEHEHGGFTEYDINDQNDISINSVPMLEPEPLELVLKGQVIELWSDALGERFWLVADEDDAKLLGEQRGATYTGAEARRVVQIADPSIVAEVHLWKRKFNAVLREFATEPRKIRT